MLPVSNKQVEKIMKQLGVKQEQLEAEEAVIKLSDKRLVVKNPQVIKVNFQGVETLQVTGDIEEQPLEEQQQSKQPEQLFTDEDVKTVSEKAGVEELTAKEALEKTKGDLAEAIMMLKQP